MVRERVFEYRLFRYALSAAEYGSFRRAAAALNVEPSSVSKGVRTLEHRMGVTLFERSHAGIRATAAGARFLEEAMLGLDHLERALLRVDAIERVERGELTIAHSVPLDLVGDVFEVFGKKHRDVAVAVVEGTCDASAMLVEQRRADLAFVGKESNSQRTTSLHIGDEQLFAVLPRSHGLASVREISSRDLASETIILGASGLGPLVADHLKHHLEHGNEILDLRLNETGRCDVTTMVARGFGISVAVGQFGHYVPAGVVIRPIAGLSAIPIRAVWAPSNVNPALKELRKVISEQSRMPKRS